MSACPHCGKPLPAAAPPRVGLTPMQTKLFDFIVAYVETHDFAPTFEEMADHLGIASKNGVHRLVTGLEERGRIRRLRHRARAIEIVGQGG